MGFTPTYHERNLKNIANLGDNTKKAAITWYTWLIANEIDVLIYETIRTLETQRGYLASGKSQTLKSYHIVGQALDFVPVDGKTTLWSGYGKATIKKAIAKAKELGFEWGGDWKGFIDQPHLQFNFKGYDTDTFKTKGNTITISLGVNETPKEDVAAVVKDTKETIADTNGNPNIKEFQSFLNNYTKKANFKELVVDGYDGPKTLVAAIRVYQYFAKVTIDGVFGAKSKAACPVVEPGTTWSKWTRLVQGLLYIHSYNPNGFDGIYGKGCTNAVKEFQKDNGLKADGEAGPATFSKFFS